MTIKTLNPQQQFKKLATQLEPNENGDHFFTGDIASALAFLEEYEDFVPKVAENTEGCVVLYSDDENYWGSGPDMEIAHRFLIGAILEQGEEE